MAKNYLLAGAESIEALRREMETLKHELLDVRRRLAAQAPAQPELLLLAKTGASIVEPMASDTAAAATVTVQKINRSTRAISAVSPARTETALNVTPERIAAQTYVLILRLFNSPVWIILPPAVLRLWRFTLNEDFAAGTAEGDLLEMDGTDTTTDVDISDSLAIFSDRLGNGDAGLCIQQGADYHAVQAPCPTS